MVSKRQRVAVGLDRLLDEGVAVAGLGAGARVGLLGHAASVDGQARHALERIGRETGLRIARLFAPEHGIWGHEQDMELVGSTVDPDSGLSVLSLYGSNEASLKPRPADLEALDALIVDLQDVGARYYTYVYTMSYVMEAAREAGIPVIVLDRPNPIGGDRLAGPVLQSELRSFVGRYPLPVRHGMTIGELARLFNGPFGIGCELTVVELRGWRRSMEFEETGLPWVAPSPNIPSPVTARVYPGGCLVEGTNLSEARGTTQPFELVGAPWLDPRALARAMRKQALEGVVFRPASFRPMFQKHAMQPCRGVQVVVSDSGLFRPFATYIVLLREALRMTSEFAWREEAYEFVEDRLAIDLLLGRSDLRAMLEAGVPLEEMVSDWQPDLDDFARLRESVLLYEA
jgi:uncharacterized protein YbbC (DUF1343 family)